MKLFTRKDQFLFAYFVETGRGFWLFEQGMYFRFLLIDGRYRFIRTSNHLPAYCTGDCVLVPPEEARKLKLAVTRCGLHVHFFTDPAVCKLAEMEKCHPDPVYGLVTPSGSFEVGNPIHRRLNDEDGHG